MKLAPIFGTICCGLFVTACSANSGNDETVSDGLLIAIDQDDTLFATQENRGVFEIAENCIRLRLDDGREFTPLFGTSFRSENGKRLVSESGKISIEFGKSFSFGGRALPDNLAIDGKVKSVGDKCGRPLFKVGPVSPILGDPPVPPQPKFDQKERLFK